MSCFREIYVDHISVYIICIYWYNTVLVYLSPGLIVVIVCHVIVFTHKKCNTKFYIV